MVQQVQQGSAADKAGLLPVRRGLGGVVPGDVIARIGSKRIARAADVAAAVDELPGAASVELEIIRDFGQAEEKRLVVTLNP